MGSWGITMRQSDYGLDLLGAIVDRQLKELDFSTFKVADALETIKADIMEEIRQANRGCSAADLVLFFSERFPYNFTQGYFWSRSALPTTTAPENLSYMITSVKTTIRLNTISTKLKSLLENGQEYSE